jgi:DNA-binding GntR family transcriptional regulator
MFAAMATQASTPKAAKKPPARGQAPVRAAEPESATGLSALLSPKNSTMMAVEQAVLRGHGAHASPPIAEQIAARLAGLIALDVLHPGQRLFENDISEVLQISRSPVREALRILERDRLVQLHARRGASVTAPDARELQDIFEVRAALFSILLEQVMRDCPADLVAVFEAFLPGLEKAATTSADDYSVQSFLANLAIADLCSNRLVVDQLKAISLRTLRYVRLGLSSSPEAIARSLKTWRMFHAAAAKRDVPAVLDLAAKRIGSIRDVSVAAMPNAQPPQRNRRSASL